jgi:UDP-glucose 4-epimerase
MPTLGRGDRLKFMRRILVTGAATWTGGRLIQRLERRANVEIYAVDEIAPRLEFTSPYRQVELDRLEFAHYVLAIDPHIVVHLQTVDREAELGKSRAHEAAVIGAQTLAGAIARSDSIRRVIVKSDAAIYGTSPRSPSVYYEHTEPHGRRGRFARDLSEMERFFTSVTTDHGVGLTVLRFANIFGSQVGNPISTYLRLPVIPSLLGFDPRLQFIHENDAVRVLEHAVISEAHGTVNIAAPGQLYLTQLVRIGRRVPQPLPKRGLEAAMKALQRSGHSLPPHLQELLRHGMVMDTGRMTTEFGYPPRLNCRQTALAAFGRVHPDLIDAKGRV